MYKLSAFYFARTSSDMPMDLVIPTVFILIVYFMSGLRTDNAKYFFENYFSVILVSECLSSLCSLGCKCSANNYPDVDEFAPSNCFQLRSLAFLKPRFQCYAALPTPMMPCLPGDAGVPVIRLAPRNPGHGRQGCADGALTKVSGPMCIMATCRAPYACKQLHSVGTQSSCQQDV